MALAVFEGPVNSGKYREAGLLAERLYQGRRNTRHPTASALGISEHRGQSERADSDSL